MLFKILCSWHLAGRQCHLGEGLGRIRRKTERQNLKDRKLPEWFGGVKCSGTRQGHRYRTAGWQLISLENECSEQVSWLQGAADKMQVWERPNALLDETWGTPGQGGGVPLHLICRARALNSSRWDHAEKHCRVSPGEPVLQEQSQNAQPA